MKLVIYSKGNRLYLALGEFEKGVFLGEDELGRPVKLKRVDFLCGDVKVKPDFNTIRELVKEDDIRQVWELGEDLDIKTLCEILGNDSPEFKASVYLVLNSTPYFKLEGEILRRRDENQVKSIIEAEKAKDREEEILKGIENILKGMKTEILEEVLNIYNYGSGDRDVERVIKKIPDFWNKFLDAGLVGITDISFEIRALMNDNTGDCIGMDFHYEDLTHLDTFSVDDEDTEDIDDAISICGNKLYIHIALPYAFCRRGCEADREALNRGATLYLPDGKWHMYPKEVVKNSSLLPGYERPTLTMEVDFDKNFGIKGYRFKVAKVINKRRLSYKNAEETLKSMGIWEDLMRISGYLRDLRVKRGGVVIDNHFLKVLLRDGEILISVEPPNDASRIITELMIFYNSKAGEFLANRGIPAIFRVQNEPVEGEIPEPNDPLYYPKIKSLSKPITSSTKPGPHLTTGVDYYTRVTSPIRRYSDVLNQHQILAALGYIEPLKEEVLAEEMQRALSGEYKRHNAQRNRTNFLILHKILLDGLVEGIAYNETYVFLPEYLFLNAKSTKRLEVGKRYKFRVKRVFFSSQKVILSPLE
ncbi:MAG: ribonuclease catalytic domain-containing protein [candidate division WOR-3 bacterium]